MWALVKGAQQGAVFVSGTGRGVGGAMGLGEWREAQRICGRRQRLLAPSARGRGSRAGASWSACPVKPRRGRACRWGVQDRNPAPLRVRAGQGAAGVQGRAHLLRAGRVGWFRRPGQAGTTWQFGRVGWRLSFRREGLHKVARRVQVWAPPSAVQTSPLPRAHHACIAPCRTPGLGPQLARAARGVIPPTPQQEKECSPSKKSRSAVDAPNGRVRGICTLRQGRGRGGGAVDLPRPHHAA
ncbi:MAG: hypothetical protein J3K34DRAFT_420711 [Monoraphidium minutum]|nr:MAG: hypothetical protein J3K34DRAFT_420711 [Monoraphidium minutum]